MEGSASTGGAALDADAEDLIARVLTAGGELRLELAREAEAAHERLVERRLRSPARPKGKKLRKVKCGGGPASTRSFWTEHFDGLVEPRPFRSLSAAPNTTRRFGPR